jgi:anti-anti-sigma factor
MVEAQPPPLLRVSVEKRDDAAVVRLDGELDFATAPQVEDALSQILTSDQPPRRIYVDADRLAFADVSGLAPLVKAAQRLPHGELQLRNARRQVVRVIRLLDLADALGLDH